jgi:hypothetical protein
MRDMALFCRPNKTARTSQGHKVFKQFELGHERGAPYKREGRSTPQARGKEGTITKPDKNAPKLAE